MTPSSRMQTNPQTTDYIVHGTVLTVDGTPLVDYIINAVDVDIRSEQLLGSTRTSKPDGSYVIPYYPDKVKPLDRGSADLKIYVYDPAKKDVVLAKSEIKFNAPKDCTIDIVVGGTTVKGPPEFDVLAAKILPLLGKLEPSQIVEDDEHQDISFLVGELDEQRERVEFFALACQFHAETKIDPDIFYGVLRKGLPTDLGQLLGQSVTQWRDALNAAMSENIIRTRSNKELEPLLQAVVRQGVRRAVQIPGQEGKTALGALLSTGFQSPALFVEALTKAENPSVEEFWAGLEAKPEFKGKVAALQSTVQLGILTLSHTPLVQELQRQKKNFADLTQFSVKGWLKLIQHPVSKIGVPPEVPGDTEDEKALNYATALSHAVEDAMPAKHLVDRLTDPDDDAEQGHLPTKPQLLSFLQKNPKFDFTTQRLPDYLSKNRDALLGLESPDLVKSTVQAIQRVYSIAPRYNQTRALIADGIHSAMQISRMGQSAFAARYGTALGGKAEAYKIFERSEQVHATSFNLIATYGLINSKIKTPVWLDWKVSQTTVDGHIPDLETLFGSMDMCACEECRSIDGPAAYYVDILHFLKDRRLIDKIERDRDGNIDKVTLKRRRLPGSNVEVEMNVKDVLFDRRPDLGEIELTCQNTNTPLPYIDLTIEVLEDAIRPPPKFKKVTLPDTAAVELNALNLQNIRALFTPPLTSFATATVVNRGEWWEIDESAYTYSIQIEEKKIKAVWRSRQTKGSAAERAANPQYMNAGAYEVLRKQVYPWNLPFDLWTETVRTYLAHIDVQRWRVTEALSPTPRPQTLQRLDIALEQLRLTKLDADLISGNTTGQPDASQTGLWNLWGFNTEVLDVNNGIPDPSNKDLMITGGLWTTVLTSRLDIFLRQSSLKYNQLRNLIQIYKPPEKPVLSINPIKGANAGTCNLKDLQLDGADVGALHWISRFIRLFRKLEGHGWTVLTLGQALNTFGSQSLLSLAHIERLRAVLDIPLQAILAFWAPISTHVYIDHEDEDEDVEPASFFASVFKNKTVVTNPPDPIFNGDPTNLSGSLSASAPAISGALNIAARDLSVVLQSTIIVVDDELSLSNLSQLYRHSVLAKALGLKIRDYLLLLKVRPFEVFEDTSATVAFVESVSRIVESGFSFIELNYLLCHDFTDESRVHPTDSSLSQILEELRSDLQKISNENTFDDEEEADENGEITKKKLILLGWPADVVTQTVAMLNNSTSFTVPIGAPLPNNLIFPEGLQDKLSYDATDETALRLTYTRVMTIAERDELLNVPHASNEYKVAINALFEIPRTFFKRNLSSFLAQLQDFSTNLADLPTSVKFPSSLKRKLFFDPTAKTLHFLGVMSESEKQAILVGVDQVANVAFVEAVDALFAAPDTFNTTADVFLTHEDVSTMFDASKIDDKQVATSDRSAILLKKLLPVLKDRLSSRLVTQKVGQYLGVEDQITEALLTKWVRMSGGFVGLQFRVPAFIDSSTKVPVTKIAFPTQFNALVLLKKIALIVSKFGLSKKELRWLFDYRTSTPSDPTTGWLDLNALPLQLVPADAVRFLGWERLVTLFQLRDSLPLGTNTLDIIFTMARNSGGDPIQELSKKTQWLQKDVEYLAGPAVFNLALPDAFRDEIALTKIVDALKLIRKIGCSAADAALFAKPELGEIEARAVVHTVKSKYDETMWLTVARPLRNILREKQRAALVAYLVAHPLPGIVPIWQSPNDLYAYFLMDVEMGPCQLTSRIKQAISVTQLFTQRCLMNLERRQVLASSEFDVRWNEWKTLKSFRITSAARQIFEKPENFLDSALRDDKSPFYKELETELQQNDLTQSTAEVAFANYLEKLDTVASLEVLAYYHQEEIDAAGNTSIDIIHIFARSRGTPSQYFYRKRVDSAEWTSWEKMDVDVTGSHLIPVMWGRRLYLFWAVMTEKQAKTAITMPSGSNGVPVGNSFWEIKLAWSELKNGKWLAKKISEDFILCWKAGHVYIQDFDEPDMQKKEGRSNLTFKVVGGGDSTSLRIDCKQIITAPDLIGYFFFDGMKMTPTVTSLLRGEPLPASIDPLLFFYSYIACPTGTTPRWMSFGQIGDGRTGGTSGGKLYLTTRRFSTALAEQSKSKVTATKGEALVLRNIVGPGLFNIIHGHQDHQFSSQRPFFFQHQNRSFFVEPEDVALRYDPRIWLKDAAKLNPLLLDGSYFSQYLEKTRIPTPHQPFPGPEIVGPLVGNPSFDISTTGIQSHIKTSIGAARELRSLTLSSTMNRNIDKLDLSRIDVKIDSIFPRKKVYKFSSFYHPFVTEFTKHLNRDGIDGLLQRPVQLSKRVFFGAAFDPNRAHVAGSYPEEEVDFDLGGSMSQYNWELFFHIPILIAERLSQNQRFQEAQKWFHYIFDPTDTSNLKSPMRYWRMKTFFETEDPQYAEETIQNLMRFLAKRGNPQELAALSADLRKRLEVMEEAVKRWRKDPFNPYLVARTRTTAFQKAVVMKYLDNLIAWGDHLFRQDTIESINEATQLFILAAEILGERPSEIAPRAKPRVQTFNTLEDKLDSFSNALVQIEELVPAAPSNKVSIRPTKYQPQVASSNILYFCVPKNSKLLGYWDIVSDRLFKIRNCMNLQGIVRELALFEPPIDPMLLVKASAAGVDLGSVLSDMDASLPYYKFTTMNAKANEVCNELRGLGSALLTALEKRDAESLALLRASHEITTLEAVRKIKEKSIQEASEALSAVGNGKSVVQERFNYYNTIAFMNPWEIAHMSMEGLALVLQIIEAATQPVAASLALIPEIKVGAPTSVGVTYGGANLSYSASYFGAFLSRSAGLLSKGAGMAATMGSHWRRKDDWDLQKRLASKELDQFDKQIAGASVRLEISTQELSSHDLQQENAKEIRDYLESKFNNVELYDWMIGQLSTLYFQSYQMAYDISKRAERAYAFELGLPKADFVQFGYWDSMKKGLLAGEKLAYDLKRMELSYLDQDRREYEITKAISLVQLDPVALIQLKETGECFFGVPEALFDLDYPGHYFRRIRTVGVTVPCVVGPHSSFSSTLTLLKSSVRVGATLSNGKYGRRDNDTRFRDFYAPSQSIVTSTGQNDSGLFETNLRDERFLPFERTGVISSWRLQLGPATMAQIDFQTITDVILHFKYTAREAGEPLRSQAISELKAKTLDSIAIAESQTGLARFFSLRHEFPDAWHRLWQAPSGQGATTQEARLPILTTRFPFMFRLVKSLNIFRIEVFIRVKEKFLKSTHGAAAVKFAIVGEDAPEDEPNPPLELIEWKGVLRGAKTLDHSPGVFIITTWLDDGGLVLREAVDEIMLVAHYAAIWPPIAPTT
ncbi:hypothetical protein BU24DRAFT_484769 [Aaosphaeria arxii CBS 175.79]|uniref:Virulence plasmid A protein n=1 Tax=Aaosphaeria arxii CBS 175.79 TaxID=1450172 RepID=A0A6A5XJH7_9PLEO|nr:uncharacterized protein BU24DRAFT_484769 [Aaosphaeria arxii CBS 175.79]KAF2012900.1 hypothetical protein BU24DRAFT_484769 [Aaosphaeria arxii CBS 175.79]